MTYIGTAPDDELKILSESEVPVPFRIRKKVTSTGSNRRRREDKMKKIQVEKLQQVGDKE